MIFADASALIAIIADEGDADNLADALERDGGRLYSAMSAWETVAGLRRSYGLTIPRARAHLQRFLDAGDFHLVAIADREYELATDAYARFGKGRHPASLNMGDCFAYACARSNNATLLYKGEDFSRTDLA